MSHNDSPSLAISANDILQKNPNIPAITLPLYGQHLIEASAGTGKTWTLTGIVLRLLIEGGYPCEKIIATTFTRSAAADIQAKIRERLVNFMQVLSLAQSALQQISEKKTDPKKLPEQFLQEMKQLAPRIGKILLSEDGEAEAVFWHLLTWLAHQQFLEKNTQTINIRIAENRCRIALNQLDKLYVGTLDSLCQKWLREFSAETGYQPDIQITTNAEPLIKSMLHDQLRAFQEAIYVNDPKLYDKLQAGGQLPKVDDYYDAVDKALTFYSVPIDSVPLANYDLAQLESLVEKINQVDRADFEPYTDEAYRLQEGFIAKRVLTTKFDVWKSMVWLLKTHGLLGVWQFNKSQLEWLDNLQQCVEQGKSFSTKKPEALEKFKNVALVKLLVELYQAIQQADNKTANIRHYFTQFISHYIRQQLPLVLESKRQTTFSLQLARLNQALASKQGEALARYIRHQYPVALIDESQDINTEQALLLQKIYLPKNLPSNQNAEKNVKPSKHFLLLVGDPKQAIYGFRGGDVANYNQIKRQFSKNNIHELTVNRRSSSDLVMGLNHFFGMPSKIDLPVTKIADPTIATQPYFLGEGIFYRHITAYRAYTKLQPSFSPSLTANDTKQAKLFTSSVSSPSDPAIVVLQIDELQKQAQSQALDITITMETTVSAQILALFDSEKKYTYDTKPLKFADIGILATGHKLLDNIEKELHRHSIPTMRGGSQSLFAGEMAQIMLVLMNTLIYPYHIARFKRLLMTPLFGLNLAQVEQLLQQELEDNPLNNANVTKTPLTQFIDIQNSLTEAHKIWQKQGFLASLQSWLDLPMQMMGEKQAINFWQRLAIDPNGERLLIDLRHLMDVISQFTKGMGEHQLLDWLALMISEQPKDEWSIQQRLASEDGVQLMTMHTSKGLEFPIVFAVGLEKSLDPKKPKSTLPALYLYTDNGVNAIRRLSPLSYKDDKDQEIYKEIEKQAEYEDRLRLAYVAVTRAKDLLYLTAETPKKSQTTPLSRWLTAENLQVPERLQGFITQANINSLSKYFHKNYQVPNKENTNTTQTASYQQWLQQISHTKFLGWSNTSFTALTHHLNQDKIATAINEPDYASVEESDTPELKDVIFGTADDMSGNNVDMTELPMRFAFEKGARAGTFLHQVLENLMDINTTVNHESQNPQDQMWQPNSVWSAIIDKAVKEAQLPSSLLSSLPNDTLESGVGVSNEQENVPNLPNPSHIALAQWLYEVMQTPLQASGISLQQIPTGKKLAELGFNMSLGNKFSLSKLQKLFKDHDIPLNFELNQPTNQYWRYLRGEIDLVYQHNGRFFVVDYKSNWLGTDFEDYHETALKQTMTEHGYWLQASIYQVALHRYLSLRLPNYDINTHLGAVEYAFIRGMSPNLPKYGKLVWQPDSEFILALDALFGTAG